MTSMCRLQIEAELIPNCTRNTASCLACEPLFRCRVKFEKFVLTKSRVTACKLYGSPYMYFSCISNYFNHKCQGHQNIVLVIITRTITKDYICTKKVSVTLLNNCALMPTSTQDKTKYFKQALSIQNKESFKKIQLTCMSSSACY